MTYFRRMAVLGALIAAPAIAAPQFEDLDLLEARITVTLGAGIGQPGGPARPIDRRLKLAACPAAPALAMPTPASALVQCEPLGWRIHVPLFRPAAAMAAAAEKAEPVVRKGDQVELVADGGSFSVSTLAIAQQDGAPGDRIRVRTEAKAAPVIAQVDSMGRVIIGRFK
jgi:flagella basal body P-ring formation protein FlgA